MLSVSRYSLFVITLCFVGVLMASLSLRSYANTVKVVPLQHRDAGDVKKAITPLLSKDSAISVDNNSVIIRAPDALMKSLVRAIKAIDKPRVQLQIFIFRGQYPDKKGIKSFTTNTHINQSNTIRVEEGQTFVVTEKRLLKVDVGSTDYANNSGQSTVTATSLDTSATTIVVNDGVLDTLANAAITGNDDTNLGELILDGQASIPVAEALTSTRSELMAVPSGLHVRVTLAGAKQARVAAKIVSAVDQQKEVSEGIEAIELTRGVETLSTFSLNTWAKLSESQTFSHRPVMNTQRKVYSTQTTDDQQQAVWMKVEVLP